MTEPAVNAVTHCINPDCQRPVVRSLTAHVCPTCKTTLRLDDRYIPLEQLSSNRYTATYLVYDLRAKTDIVLKVLLETNPRAVEWFRYTAKVLSSMRCSGLPRVIVGSHFLVPLRGSVHSLPCFVMEDIPGRSLQDTVDAHPGGCPESWVQEWLQQMLDALHFLHSRQYIHGNLTPDNLLLRDDTDQVVLIGFGNPKPLMAVTGAVATETDDLFALGRICIQLLTGIHPLELEDGKTRKLRWRNRVRVSGSFSDLLDKLTHPSPHLRPKTALEVKTTLAELTAKKAGVKPKSTKQQSHAPAKSRAKSEIHKKAQLVNVMQSVSVNRPLPVVGEILLTVIQAMMHVAVVSAIATAVGFWLIFYSPFSGAIQQGVTLVTRSLPFSVSPGMVLFMIAGIGTSWGLMLAHSDRSGSIWQINWLAGVGYGLSWLSWQWSQGDRHPVQAITRLTAIAALVLAIQLGNRAYWWLQWLVICLGTSVTMGVLVRSQQLRFSSFYPLFAPSFQLANSFNPSLFTTSMIFFASLGAIVCFWSKMSQQFVIPLVKQTFRK